MNPFSQGMIYPRSIVLRLSCWPPWGPHDFEHGPHSIHADTRHSSAHGRLQAHYIWVSHKLWCFTHFGHEKSQLLTDIREVNFSCRYMINYIIILLVGCPNTCEIAHLYWLTNCVGHTPAWLLVRWSRSGAVALLQVLVQRAQTVHVPYLYARTALRAEVIQETVRPLTCKITWWRLI